MMRNTLPPLASNDLLGRIPHRKDRPLDFKQRRIEPHIVVTVSKKESPARRQAKVTSQRCVTVNDMRNVQRFEKVRRIR